MKATASLSRLGYPLESSNAPAASPERFPDGAEFRVEIPSVEGPAVLESVLAAGRDFGVTINRVSQGSGGVLLRESEMREMAVMGAEAGLEISLFVGPRGGWDIGVHTRSEDGAGHFGHLRGMRQLTYATEDVLRAVDCGIRGFLVADPGHLTVLRSMQQNGEIPAEVVWKVSVLAGGTNPATMRLLEELGAGSANIPSDATLGHVAEMRATTPLPIDLYLESPDSLGGVVRGHEISDFVKVGAPIYTKFGLRNSRMLYPSGLHTYEDAKIIGREKVRRAAIALEWLQRLRPDSIQSEPHAAGLGVPVSPASLAQA
jgi:hypothetical protein